MFLLKRQRSIVDEMVPLEDEEFARLQGYKRRHADHLPMVYEMVSKHLLYF